MTLPVLPYDKALHANYGAVIGAVAAVAASHFLGAQYAGVAALGAAALAGAGKEVVDYLQNRYQGTQHGVELLDALATVAGGAAVALPLLV